MEMGNAAIELFHNTPCPAAEKLLETGLLINEFHFVHLLLTLAHHRTGEVGRRFLKRIGADSRRLGMGR